MTIPEVSLWLNVGRNFAYELVKCGRLQSIKVGSLLRVPKGALVALVTQREFLADHEDRR